MTNAILITISTLLLLAYFFDLTSRWSRIPSVILLLLMGWGIQQALDILGIELPDMSGVLPVMGTLGLILIVLEGAMELQINPSKKPLLIKSFLGAGLTVLMLSIGIGSLVCYAGSYTLKASIASVIPLCVISSSIAIPTARNLADQDREYVVYESSMSDVLGVVLFNFVALNEIIDAMAFMKFGIQLAIMVVLSIAASFGLTYMLRRSQHHIRFMPVILWTVLLYAITKVYHLPNLLFILVFGLVLGNLAWLGRLRFLTKFSLGEAVPDVKRFHELIGEVAFLIRSLFFLLFGYTLKTAEIVDTDSMIWSVGIVAIIFLARAAQLRISGFRLSPLLFIAPRGLITILLFLSLPEGVVVPLVNRSVLTQVIVLTSLVMMAGMMTATDKKAEGV